MILVAAVAVVVAVGAGFFALRNMAQLDQLESELNATKTSLDKARGELKKATQDLAATTKEAMNLKLAADRLTMERDAVRATIENEQAAGVRLRAELELAKDQISYLSARSTKEIVRGMPKNAASR